VLRLPGGLGESGIAKAFLWISNWFVGNFLCSRIYILVQKGKDK
jgi:hypothetical protein